MKLKDFNWRILRTPLLVLICSIGVSAAWVYFSNQWVESTRVTLERERSVLNGIRQKSTQADQEKQLIQRYREAYRSEERRVGKECCR